MTPNLRYAEHESWVAGQFGGTMTKIRAAIGFLLAVAAAGVSSLRRTIKRLAAPGTGPFLSGV